ncbi:hypothetical protein [Acinetobacter nosocomialis]|uniref:hypothetical protein n=1 Tax=Acinetobacter nosocomialis TaxID=106654 RepID=UPI001B823302|nr:hypothetical protein [Acinetobacter nosocomialis]MBR7773332.1 hypothetical protein [Acinetobacter nosocomialis]
MANKKWYIEMFEMHNLVVHVTVFITVFLVVYTTLHYMPLSIAKTNWTLFILVFNIVAPIGAIGASYFKMSDLKAVSLELSNEEIHRLQDNIKIRLRLILKVFLFIISLAVIFSFLLIINVESNLNNLTISLGTSLTICAILLLYISWKEADEINQFKADVLNRNLKKKRQEEIFKKTYKIDEDI